MANTAHNFAFFTKQAWENGGKHAEHDAVKRAVRLGGRIVANVLIPDNWINEPGDEPGYLIVFPDNSEYVVGQNGHWTHAAYEPGPFRKPAYTVI